MDSLFNCYSLCGHLPTFVFINRIHAISKVWINTCYQVVNLEQVLWKEPTVSSNLGPCWKLKLIAY